MRQTVAKLNLPQCTQEVVMLVSVSFLMGQSASSSASLLKFQLSSWFQESESLSPTRFWFSSRPSSLMNPLLGAPSITIARASAITEGLSSAAYRILCTAFTTCFQTNLRHQSPYYTNWNIWPKYAREDTNNIRGSSLQSLYNLFPNKLHSTHITKHGQNAQQDANDIWRHQRPTGRWPSSGAWHRISMSRSLVK